MSTQYNSSTTHNAPLVERILLPTQVIEKPVAVHEEIRRELVEEIQPVINVEKVKTEIHQVTQPLFDKEVRAVTIENRTLNTEILPEVITAGRGVRSAEDISTTSFVEGKSMVVEKPALINQIEKTQIIQEIQPVIYKETVVPTVIQETKPVYQKIVEGNVYTQETLGARSVSTPSHIAPAYVPSNEVIAPTHASVMLPTQVIQKPVAVHEEVRRETIEEIQPVVNVEKIKTEVHQVTQPLFDKEVKPVSIEQRVLATEVLAEVHTEGRGLRAVEDRSTTQYLDTKATLIEKPAIYNEIERIQIIEEIQPVVYKETVVPTVIRETKPVYQKIVEGVVYTHETLPARSLHDTNFQYPTSTQIVQPAVVQVVVPVAEILTPRETIIVEKPILAAPIIAQPHGIKEVIEETVTTTTTTSAAPIVGGSTHASSATSGSSGHGHHLFHRHDKGTTASTHAYPTAATTTGTSHTLGHGSHGAPVEHFHNERTAPNGQKIIEDTTVTHSHTESARLL